jgi:hypothetical protein
MGLDCASRNFCIWAIPPDHKSFGAILYSTTQQASTLSQAGGPVEATVKRPEYVRNIVIAPAFSADQLPLVLGGVSAVTLDRLRVFVDYSTHRNGWVPRTRVAIGEIKEPVQDQNIRMQLVYSGKPEGAGNNDLWWGNPNLKEALPPPDTNFFLPAIPVRARVVFIGPSGEQHYYFMVLRGADGSANRIGILRQHELDWVADWERSTPQ